MTAADAATPGDESRRVKAFRVGLARRLGDELVYKPAATIGLAADGGVFVSPCHRGGKWQYGITDRAGAGRDDYVTTDQTPKLHYHRSGIAAITLTGHELERRAARYPSLEGVESAQILSILTLRSWELPTKPGPIRSGDVVTSVLRWPDVAYWNVFWVRADPSARQKLLTGDTPSRGLLAGRDFTHGVVSLAAHGHEAILLVAVSTDDSWEELPATGGTTVAAFDWKAGAPDADVMPLALWSARLRNPIMHWSETAPSDLEPVWSTSIKSDIVSHAQLAPTTMPGGGFVDRVRSKRPGADSWHIG